MPRKSSRPEDPEVVAALARYRASRDPVARNFVIERCKPLVDRTIEKMLPQLPTRIERGDLRAEGYRRLVRAVDTFDPARKTRFETFAIALIRTGILDWLRTDDHLPEKARALHRKFERAREAVTARLKRKAFDAEVAAELGLDLDTFYQQWFDLGRRAPLVIEGIPSYTHNTEDADYQYAYTRATNPHREPAAETPNPLEVVLKNETAAAVRAALANLSDDEREIILLHHYEEVPLRELPERIGISKTEARDRYRRALSALRAGLGGDPREE